MSSRSLAHPFGAGQPVALPHPGRAVVLAALGAIGLVAAFVMWLDGVHGVWFAFFIAAAVALLASGLSLLTGESRRTRAAAPRAVSPGWSSEALSHLSRRWTRIDRVPVGGDEPVDHVLVSTAGVFAVTTRFTSSDWSTSSPALARAVAHAHDQAARIPGASAVPVLVVWGPGAPPVPGGWELHDDVMVCRGSSDAAWRAHLEALPATVAPGQVHALVRRLTP